MSLYNVHNKNNYLKTIRYNKSYAKRSQNNHTKRKQLPTLTEPSYKLTTVSANRQNHFRCCSTNIKILTLLVTT